MRPWPRSRGDGTANAQGRATARRRTASLVGHAPPDGRDSQDRHRVPDGSTPAGSGTRAIPTAAKNACRLSGACRNSTVPRHYGLQRRLGLSQPGNCATEPRPRVLQASFRVRTAWRAGNDLSARCIVRCEIESRGRARQSRGHCHVNTMADAMKRGRGHQHDQAACWSQVSCCQTPNALARSAR